MRGEKVGSERIMSAYRLLNGGIAHCASFSKNF